MNEWFRVAVTIGTVLGGISFLGWGVLTGFKKRAEIASKAVDQAHSELVEVVRLQADAWKARYEGEHQEFTEYRDKTHAHNGVANSRILALTAENAELRSKTDLSPILRFHEDQARRDERISVALERIVQFIEKHDS